MRRRIRKSVSPQGDTTVRVKTIEYRGAVKLVTLEDPNAPPTAAQDAFARLRPPEGLTALQVDSWRDVVAKVARAVKVLPAPRSADVPTDSKRTAAEDRIGTVREEALLLANETGNPGVIAMVTEALDKVGA